MTEEGEDGPVVVCLPYPLPSTHRPGKNLSKAAWQMWRMKNDPSHRKKPTKSFREIHHLKPKGVEKNSKSDCTCSDFLKWKRLTFWSILFDYFAEVSAVFVQGKVLQNNHVGLLFVKVTQYLRIKSSYFCYNFLLPMKRFK